MNQMNVISAPDTLADLYEAAESRPVLSGPVCRSVPLEPLPDLKMYRCGITPLYVNVEKRKLMREFRTAPQFRNIDPKTLMKMYPDGYRLLLVTESPYYARQAAVYLSSIRILAHTLVPEYEDGFSDADIPFFDEVEDSDMLEQSAEEKSYLDDTLFTVDAGLLQSVPGENRSSGPVLNMSEIDSPGVLVTASAGPVLSDMVLFQISAMSEDKDVYLTLPPEQARGDLVERLRFEQGFTVLQVGKPDNTYYSRCLCSGISNTRFKLAPGVEPEKVIKGLRRYKGGEIDQTDVDHLIRHAIRNSSGTRLSERDLTILPNGIRSDGLKELDQMIGLESVKAQVRRILAREKLRQRKPGSAPVCRNLAFTGNPGTGKSVTARLVARILREQGCGSGRYVEAGREQLIGQHLGYTSKMVADLFSQAKGGVLFLDEVGALINTETNRDIFVDEAINALVRHMELHPETMVIFATYPREMEKFLNSNPGLHSRIAGTMQFEDYTGEELWQILGIFCRKEGYTLPEEAKQDCLDFFDGLRTEREGCFGNGREARRLFQAAQEELALRLEEDPEAEPEFLPQDFRTAADRLLVRAVEQKPKRRIGFLCEDISA